MIPFFNSTVELKEFVPGIDSKENISDFAPYAIIAEKEIVKIIGKPLWLSLNESYSNNQKVDGLKNIRGAVASFVAIEHALYDTIKRNNSERKVYKYQYNQIVTQLTERAHFYMSELLNDVKENDLFLATATAKEMNQLLIKDYVQFGNHYNIDDSAYFFHVTVFLQKEVIRNYLKSRTLKDAQAKELAEIAVAYHTVALAVERLDTMILPKSIRKDLEVNSEFVKRSDATPDAKKQLVLSLKRQGDKVLLDLDSYLQENKDNGTLKEDLSDSTDKFFVPC